MKIIQSEDFTSYWKSATRRAEDTKTDKTVKKIIADVRAKGDAAIRKYASKFDRSSPQRLEVPLTEAQRALEQLHASEGALTEGLESHAQSAAARKKFGQ